MSQGTDAGDLTGLLQTWATGGAKDREAVFEAVYPELRQIARQRLAGERAGLSLQATELVHETFLKLVGQRRVVWACRAQFFAVASTMIRRILTDHAKHRLRKKRGQGALHVSLDGVDIAQPPLRVDVLAVDEALIELARVRATVARIVELRFFGGLNLDETAEATGLSRATVTRRWRFARAWLAQRLGVAA